MTKTQLIALADELGIGGINSGMLKADMVSAILSGMEAET